MQQAITPTTIIIFGVTGDLSRRKLLPALFDLYSNGRLPEHFCLLGFSRSEMSNEAFRVFVREVIEKKRHHHAPEKLDAFLALAYYAPGYFNEDDAYRRLGERLINLDESVSEKCSNKLFYLAVPPEFYEGIFYQLANSGLTIPCGGAKGWTRVLVEKPFGKDLHTAQALDGLLGKLFREEQIFRIDHYLAKEAMQNMLAFRFSNVLFEPIWDSAHIERVAITLEEKQGIEGRGNFYDGVGALRDVGQNHLLQMFALVAMENPGAMDAAAIRSARARVLQSLRPITGGAISKSLVRGQYAGYTKEPHVASDSATETYFRMLAFVANDRWAGVPFVLESGKYLAETKTEVQVYFKKAKCLCPPDAERHHQNILTFRIQPDEGIAVVFWAKKPGFTMELEPKTLSFLYKEESGGNLLPDAYERILYDCIRGDQTLFASTEEVNASWRFITPIIEGWNELPLIQYEQGTKGPIINTNG